jgi:hypothetical protein
MSLLHSAKSLAARVIITPPPTSLMESTAILQRLQHFGRVCSFHCPTLTKAGSGQSQETEIVYASPEFSVQACNASPVTVQVNQDLPDPAIEDPYNVRGLQSRMRQGPRTFTCRIEGPRERTYINQQMLAGGFSPSNQSRLYQSLLQTGAPSSIVDALGVSTSGHGLQPMKDGLAPRTPKDLASMYRTAIAQTDSKTQPTVSAGGSYPAGEP